MARTTKIVSISVDPKELRTIDKAARRADLSRSEFLITGATRLADLQAIAADGLQAYADAHSRERPQNATEVIAESCADGRARLDALQRIAAVKPK